MAVLEEMKDLYLYDFGIFIELQPDEEERAVLENNIQAAVQSGLIDLSDAIDLREIKNLKLANQLLKIRKNFRQLMVDSPLCDSVSFAGKIEDAYMKMWTKYTSTYVKEDKKN